eukprot:PhF_6_TR25316/c0_g1_i1/m.34962
MTTFGFVLCMSTTMSGIRHRRMVLVYFNEDTGTPSSLIRMQVTHSMSLVGRITKDQSKTCFVKYNGIKIVMILVMMIQMSASCNRYGIQCDNQTHRLCECITMHPTSLLITPLSL